jgi:hypothetical protein
MLFRNYVDDKPSATCAQKGGMRGTYAPMEYHALA